MEEKEELNVEEPGEDDGGGGGGSPGGGEGEGDDSGPLSPETRAGLAKVRVATEQVQTEREQLAREEEHLPNVPLSERAAVEARMARRRELIAEIDRRLTHL
jgi:hypothetical protein